MCKEIVMPKDGEKVNPNNINNGSIDTCVPVCVGIRCQLCALYTKDTYNLWKEQEQPQEQFVAPSVELDSSISRINNITNILCNNAKCNNQECSTCAYDNIDNFVKFIAGK